MDSHFAGDRYQGVFDRKALAKPTKSQRLVDDVIKV